MDLSLQTVDGMMQRYSQQTEQMLMDYLVRIEGRIRALEQGAPEATILHRDVLALQSRIRARAAAVAEQYRLERKGELEIRTALKRGILARYGIPDLHDMPLAQLRDAQQYTDGCPIYRTVMKIREKQQDGKLHQRKPDGSGGSMEAEQEP